jgi:hypothetical protein
MRNALLLKKLNYEWLNKIKIPNNAIFNIDDYHREFSMLVCRQFQNTCIIR